MPRTPASATSSRGASLLPTGTAPSTAKIVTAFALVYLIWGSTYLAIRFAIETIPPLVMAATRFLIAGTVLYAWVRARGAPKPTAREWRGAAVVGTLLLGIGNAGVVYAEQWVPSGLTALLVGAVPLWMVLVDWGWGARVRPTRRVGVGLVVGFVGIGVLAGSPGAGAGGRHELLGGLILMGASLAWASGSIYSRHAPKPERPRLWVAMQMLVGGGVLVLGSLATGEFGALHPGAVSLKSVLGFVYLVVFGSLVGYAAYIWLLSVSTPARVSTYAYVNPVVALFLGWAVADEPLTYRSLLAAAIILGAVVLITSEGQGRVARQ